MHRFAPDTLSLLEFKNQREADLASKMYDQPLMGDSSVSDWSVKYIREFDMGNDSYLFKKLEYLDKQNYRTFPKLPSCYIGLNGDLYLPLFEGRMIHQFDHRAKGYQSGQGRSAIWEDFFWTAKQIRPQFYMLENDFRLHRPERQFYRAGFCHVTSPITERTVQAAMLPWYVPCGHTVPTLISDPQSPLVHLLWLALATSFPADWLMRLRVGYTMNFFYLEQWAVPRPSLNSAVARNLITRAIKLTCVAHEMSDLWNLIAKEHPDILTTSWDASLVVELGDWTRLRAEIDAIVTDLYGLSASDFAYILTTFPLLDRDMPALPGEPKSTITRDLALLALHRLRRQPPPPDIVPFFAAAGADISAITGPIRALETRVHEACKLGAVAYIPSGRGAPVAPEQALRQLNLFTEDTPGGYDGSSTQQY